MMPDRDSELPHSNTGGRGPHRDSRGRDRDRGGVRCTRVRELRPVSLLPGRPSSGGSLLQSWWGLRTLATPAFVSVLLVLTACLTGVALLIDSTSLSLTDFTAYYQGGSDWLRGNDPYGMFLRHHLDVPAGFRGGFIYPPYTLPFFSALALLGWTWAARLWVVLEILALASVIVMLAGLSRPRRMAACTIVVLFFFPTATSFAFGQIGLLVLAAAWAAIDLSERGRPAAGGVALGLAGLVKFFPLVAALAFITRARFRAAMIAVMTLSGVAVASLPWTGALWPEYLQGILLVKSTPSLNPGNQSIAAAVGRMVGAQPPAALLEVAFPIAVVVVIVAALLIARPGDDRLRYALLLSALPLIVPNGLQHYYVFSLPLIWILLLAGCEGRDRWAFAAVITAELALSVTPASSSLWSQSAGSGESIVSALLLNSSAIGGLLLAGSGVALLLLRRHRLAAEPEDQLSAGFARRP